MTTTAQRFWSKARSNGIELANSRRAFWAKADTERQIEITCELVESLGILDSELTEAGLTYVPNLALWRRGEKPNSVSQFCEACELKDDDRGHTCHDCGIHCSHDVHVR